MVVKESSDFEMDITVDNDVSVCAGRASDTFDSEAAPLNLFRILTVFAMLGVPLSLMANSM